MNLVMIYPVIGFVWALLVQIGLRALDENEEQWDAFTILVNIIIWPFSMFLFVNQLFKSFLTQNQ